MKLEDLPTLTDEQLKDLADEVYVDLVDASMFPDSDEHLEAFAALMCVGQEMQRRKMN